MCSDSKRDVNTEISCMLLWLLLLTNIIAFVTVTVMSIMKQRCCCSDHGKDHTVITLHDHAPL